MPFLVVGVGLFTLFVGVSVPSLMFTAAVRAGLADVPFLFVVRDVILAGGSAVGRHVVVMFVPASAVFGNRTDHNPASFICKVKLGRHFYALEQSI